MKMKKLKEKIKFTITDTKSDKRKRKLFKKNCIVEFPLLCTLYDVGKNEVEIHFDKSDFYSFKLKSKMQGIKLASSVTPIKTKKDLEEIKRISF